MGKGTHLREIAIIAVVMGALGLGIRYNQKQIAAAAELQQKLEPTAIHSTDPMYYSFRDLWQSNYKDVDGNGKLESVVTDSKTDVEYVMERDQKTNELRIYPLKKRADK